ncbi:MAG: sigma-70 family RNA polymerase sigma factor [Saprospiraceae bacterium]|nr:sigma-70 family RNA polymerase sigma factor [Saprospiraceae bacterium]
MWFNRSKYNEEAVITGCVSNDRKSQELLYNHMFDKMYCVCAKYTKDETEALTILNDGFLRVYKNIASYNFSGSFEGWVRKIIYRSVADYFRNKSNKLAFLLPDEDFTDVTHSFTALDDLFAEDIIRLLEQLPDASSRVLVLYAIEGYTHKEIGTILQISENTSKWHLSNARQILKQKLSDYQYNNYTG